MEKMITDRVPPELSFLSAQGGRVTGKAAKERPKKNKKNFREYLASSGRGKAGPEGEGRINTLA